jgi:hypothetical protein
MSNISSIKLPPVSTRGMHYMNGQLDGSPFAEVLAGLVADGLLGDDLLGFGWSSLNPVNVIKTVNRYSPHSLIARQIAKRRGGGAPRQQAPSMPEPTPAPEEATAESPEGGGEEASTEGLYGMLQRATGQQVYDVNGRLLQGLRNLNPLARLRLLKKRAAGAVAARRARGLRGRRRPSWRGRSAAATSGSLASLAKRAYKGATSREGKTLISFLPYGATAVQAHSLATRALKSGDLQPQHLKAAGDLTRAGRSGNDTALVRIAAIKRQADQGDPAARKALDTLRIAHTIQTGQPVRNRSLARQGSAYNQGLAALMTRR